MTLLDSNVVIDMVIESEWAEWAFDQLGAAAGDGPVAINHVVLAELHAGPVGAPSVDAALAALAIGVAPLTDAAAVRAGQAHRLYRDRGGERTAILADFLIGGHAVAVGAKLLTRDRRRFASYFPELDLIAPEEA